MAAEEDIRVAVMMVGGRRCGKTSVLAAMKDTLSLHDALPIWIISLAQI